MVHPNTNYFHKHLITSHYPCIILFLQSKKTSSGRIMGLAQAHRTDMRPDRLRCYWRRACPVINYSELLIDRSEWPRPGGHVHRGWPIRHHPALQPPLPDHPVNRTLPITQDSPCLAFQSFAHPPCPHPGVLRACADPHHLPDELSGTEDELCLWVQATSCDRQADGTGPRSTSGCCAPRLQRAISAQNSDLKAISQTQVKCSVGKWGHRLKQGSNSVMLCQLSQEASVLILGMHLPLEMPVCESWNNWLLFFKHFAASVIGLNSLLC